MPIAEDLRSEIRVPSHHWIKWGPSRRGLRCCALNCTRTPGLGFNSTVMFSLFSALATWGWSRARCWNDQRTVRWQSLQFLGQTCKFLLIVTHPILVELNFLTNPSTFNYRYFMTNCAPPRPNEFGTVLRLNARFRWLAVNKQGFIGVEITMSLVVTRMAQIRGGSIHLNKSGRHCKIIGYRNAKCSRFGSEPNPNPSHAVEEARCQDAVPRLRVSP